MKNHELIALLQQQDPEAPAAWVPVDQLDIAHRARLAGLNPRCVYSRIEKGMSIEQALSTPKNSTRLGKVAKAAIAARISVRTVRQRISNGMTLEQAISTPLSTNQSRRVSRADRIAEEWGRPADDVIRELRAEGKSMKSIAGIIGACHNWTVKRVHELEREDEQPSGTQSA